MNRIFFQLFKTRKDEVLGSYKQYATCALFCHFIWSAQSLYLLMNNSSFTNTSHATEALPLNMFRLKSCSKYSKCIWTSRIISCPICFLHFFELNALLVSGCVQAQVECPSCHERYRIKGMLAYMTSKMPSNWGYKS